MELDNSTVYYCYFGSSYIFKLVCSYFKGYYEVFLKSSQNPPLCLCITYSHVGFCDLYILPEGIVIIINIISYSTK